MHVFSITMIPERTRWISYVIEWLRRGFILTISFIGDNDKCYLICQRGAVWHFTVLDKTFTVIHGHADIDEWIEVWSVYNVRSMWPVYNVCVLCILCVVCDLCLLCLLCDLCLLCLLCLLCFVSIVLCIPGVLCRHVIYVIRVFCISVPLYILSYLYSLLLCVYCPCDLVCVVCYCVIFVNI